jgi:hypothetical protein
MRSENEPYNNRARENVTTGFASQISDANYAALQPIDDGSPQDSEQVSPTPLNPNRWIKLSIHPIATGVINKIKRSRAWASSIQVAMCTVTNRFGELVYRQGSSHSFRTKSGQVTPIRICWRVHLRPKGQSRSERSLLDGELYGELYVNYTLDRGI